MSDRKKRALRPFANILVVLAFMVFAPIILQIVYTIPLVEPRVSAESVLQSLKEFQARAKAQEQKEMTTEKSKARKKGDVEL